VIPSAPSQGADWKGSTVDQAEQGRGMPMGELRGSAKRSGAVKSKTPTVVYTMGVGLNK
jgi:hypothetical protein